MLALFNVLSLTYLIKDSIVLNTPDTPSLQENNPRFAQENENTTSPIMMTSLLNCARFSHSCV